MDNRETSTSSSDDPILKSHPFSGVTIKGRGDVGRVYFVRRPSRQSFGFRAAASSGPIPKAPGSAGGYLLAAIGAVYCWLGNADCRRAAPSAGRTPEATWLLAVRSPSTSCPSGGRVSGLLPTQALDGLYGAAGTMPAEEFEFLVLECVCGPEELFQLLPCPGRKVADVLQIGLERGAVGHREHTVVPFLLALGLLLDLEDPDGFASKHHAGIGLRVVDDQNVERVAVFRLGRRNEAPVVRIGEASHQRLGKREHAQRRIEVQLAATAARRLDDSVNVLVVCPCRN